MASVSDVFKQLKQEQQKQTFAEGEEIIDSNNYCMLESDTTRQILIPEKYSILGVESDEKVKTVKFAFPRYVDDGRLDLMDYEIRINYKTANPDEENNKDQTQAQNVHTVGEYIVFEWLLSRRVTQYKGTITFIVCAITTEEDGTITTEWNTTLATSQSIEGLEVSLNENEEQQARDLLTELLVGLNNSKNDAVTEITQTKIQAISDVQAEGQTQTEAVDAKGAQVLESIPKDYTQLQNDVSTLSNDIGNITNLRKIKLKYFLNKRIDINSGKILPSIGRIAVIDYYNADNVKIEFDESVSVSYCVYNKDKTYTGEYSPGGWIKNSPIIINKPDKLIRISVLISENELIISDLDDIDEKVIVLNQNNNIVSSVIRNSESVIRNSESIIEINKKIYGFVDISQIVEMYDSNSTLVDNPEQLGMIFYESNEISGNETLIFELLNTHQFKTHWYNEYNSDGDLIYTKTLIDSNNVFYVKTKENCSKIKFSIWNENVSVTVKKVEQTQEYTYISAIGDSITQGHSQDGRVTNTYQKLISEKLGCEYQNLGISSTPICPNTDYTGDQNDNAFIYRYDQINDNADLILICGGTNDFRHNAPIGENTDTEETTFYGALDILLNGICSNHSDARIVFVTPFHQVNDTKANSKGHYLEDYIKAIQYKCKEYGVLCIDAFSESGVNLKPYFIEKYMPDSLHPNESGHKLIYKNIMHYFSVS